MDKGVLERMKEVQRAVLQLDQSIRGQAFAMMRSYILGSADEAGVVGRIEPKRTAGSGNATDFLKRHESDKDHENVLAAAAWWYSQYGNAWFDPNRDLRAIADQAGLTVSIRIDMTIRQLKRDDKPVFRKSGTRYQPTPHGERYLKKTFGVTKGTGVPPTEES